MKFDEWYEAHGKAIEVLRGNKDVAFYVWNNYPRTSAKTSAKIDGGYTQDFENFWSFYPKKIGKGGAYSVWKLLVKRIAGDELSTLCQFALEWQTKTDQWKADNGKYIPNPETYLRNRRWEDERPRNLSIDTQPKERYLDMNGVWRER